MNPARITSAIRAPSFARKEMTWPDLAERVGAARQTITTIEQGKYSPSLEVAFRIARALGVRPDDVFQYLDSGEEAG